jgi:hypothetical protein
VLEYSQDPSYLRDLLLAQKRIAESPLSKREFAAGPPDSRLPVVHLSVLGSVARGEASAEPDIDLLADFDSTRRYSLWIGPAFKTVWPISSARRRTDAREPSKRSFLLRNSPTELAALWGLAGRE